MIVAKKRRLLSAGNWAAWRKTSSANCGPANLRLSNSKHPLRKSRPVPVKEDDPRSSDFNRFKSFNLASPASVMLVSLSERRSKPRNICRCSSPASVMPFPPTLRETRERQRARASPAAVMFPRGVSTRSRWCSPPRGRDRDRP